MIYRLKFLALSVCAALATPSSSVEIQKTESEVIFQGVINSADIPKIEQAFQGAVIKRVVFKNCTGGQLGAFEALRSQIGLRSLVTQAVGVVASTCALAFLAGKSRVFGAEGEARPAVLILHGVYATRPEITEDILAEAKGQLLDFIREATDGKMPDTVIEMALQTRDHKLGLFIRQRNSDDAKVAPTLIIHVDEDANGAVMRTPFPGATPEGWGIVK